MAKPTHALSLGINVPDRIGKYEVGQCLGSGTCGVVYKGYDPVIYREVAIKISLNDSGETDSKKFPAAQRAFLTEAAAAGKLKHPHIVALYDAGIEENLNYLIMEYARGTPLSKYGKRQKQLPPHKVLEIIFECAQALDYSHKQGIIHRDIKPSNIMLTDEGVSKLLDFGIAISTTQKAISKGGPSLGTPNYMSPEQILGVSLGPQSDLYSLATVMFEMLTGKQLFEAKKVRDLFRCVVGQPAPRLSDVRSDLPGHLSDILDKALQKDPDKRYQTGGEFADEISRMADRMRPVSRSTSLSERRSALRDIAVFKEMTEAEIDQLAESSTLVRHNPGDVVLEEGEVDDHLYLVTSGEMVARRSGRLMEVIGCGDCFGEMGFINQEKSIATIEAVSPVSLYRISHEFFDKISSNTQLYYYKTFSKILAARLATANHPRIDHVLY
ncbi:MAG: serine/threonine-protein kinase [Pseudomonadota bacterium]